ncbi:MAG: radical SAM protein [Candidatus Thermoplasmatota archaeon]|nr:radical SAM protein [Candidatus Thermoplasmatota archaeon]MCL5962799.1 radical SAM protein [Candidatus Thermoplasmatota archaeon]
MRKLVAGSLLSGRLPVGCKLCRKGRKTVLFVTPKCSMRCFYCPISDERKKGETFANEKAVFNDDDIIEEVTVSSSTGTGITGGDPLSVPFRTLHYIKLLKETFGEKHHIHLYTITPNHKLLIKMFHTGVDEVRIHIPSYLWDRVKGSPYYSTLKQLNKEGYTAGVEIPAIPGKENNVVRLIDSLSEIEVPFINLNELEFSPTNWIRMRNRGIELRNIESAEAMGSLESVENVFSNIADSGLTVHFCSSPFKDSVQLRNRLRIRAVNVKKNYEIVTDDGTLIKGVIEGDTNNVIKILHTLKVPEKYYFVNKNKKKIEIASWILSDIYKKLNASSYITESYPTSDKLEVERTPLKIINQ